MYYIISSDEVLYRESSRDAALAAGAPLWNCYALSVAIKKLNLGDELSVDNDVSVIRISGVDIDFDGKL